MEERTEEFRLVAVDRLDAAPPESRRWSGRTRAELEAVVDAHLSDYLRVGLALWELRDRRLYEELGFEDFQEYCRSKNWGFSRMRAYQLIDAADVAGRVNHGLHGPPTNERQARALLPLKDDPEALEAAWAEVVESATAAAPITQGRIRAVVQRYRPSSESGEPAAADAGTGDAEPLTGFYSADDVLYADLYRRCLTHLGFLQREAAALEQRFRRRARRPLGHESLRDLHRLLASSAEPLDRARRLRLADPDDSPAIPGNAG